MDEDYEDDFETYEDDFEVCKAVPLKHESAVTEACLACRAKTRAKGT